MNPQDNTVILNSIFQPLLLRARKKRLLHKEAAELYGETRADTRLLEDAEEQARLLRDVSGTDDVARMLPTTSAYFFIRDQSFPVSGPINPREMCLTFFREKYPIMYPDSAERVKTADIKTLVDLAIEREGFRAAFGRDGRLEQFMSKTDYRVFKPKELVALKGMFREVADKLVWINTYSSAYPEYVEAKDAIGTTLAWRRA